MATVSRFNSDLITREELYSTAQLKVFTLTNFDSALTADTGGDGSAIVEGTARRVANGLNALLFEVNSAGTIMAVVMDGHANDATSIGRRVDQILGQDDGDTTVAEATTLAGLLS